jgi:hypothetical protein
VNLFLKQRGKSATANWRDDDSQSCHDARLKKTATRVVEFSHSSLLAWTAEKPHVSFVRIAEFISHSEIINLLKQPFDSVQIDSGNIGTREALRS